MKRKFIITVLIALMAIICMSVAACGHTHKYEDRVVPPTCTEDGYTEHECSCGDSYRDSKVAARHSLTSVAEKKATCTEEGHSAYYECSVCNKWFSDKDGQKEITDKDSVILAARHSLTFVAEKKATCTEEGHSAYYICSACNKWFSDENGKVEITDKNSIITKKIPHSYVDGACTQCGRKQPTEGLKYKKIGGKEEYAVSGIGTATETDIVIPEEYCGLPVTSIDDEAFLRCKSLTSVTISDSITSIGAWAFYECSGLIDVTISDSVIIIENEAFLACDSLRNVTIPANVMSVGYGAFGYCDSLLSLDVNENNQYYKSIDGNLYSKDGKTLVQYAVGKESSSFVIPDSVTSIRDRAFGGCNNLTNVTIPDGITSVGYGAFFGCGKLTYNIKDNIRYLGNSNNPYLCLIGTTTTDITNATIDENCKVIGDSAFYTCNKLTSITIPNSVMTIGGGVFGGCSNLTSVVIGDGVTSIGSSAFYGCSSLTGITIPDGVTRIGEGALSNCNGLESIVVSEGNSVYHSYGNCLIDTESKTIIAGCKNSVIPDDGSVISIGDDAFCECDGLTSIVIPDSVTSIGCETFRDCDNLLNVTIGNGVTSIADAAFYWCNSLTSVIIGSSVTSIDDYAFYDCVFESVYYVGTADEWNVIDIGGHNDELKNATRYYYSETEPELNDDGSAYDGNYWHYDNDGNIVVWVKE